MKEMKYSTSVDPMHTVFQNAWKTDEHLIEWHWKQPEFLQHFNDYMVVNRNPNVSWLSVYPVEAEMKDWDPAAPVYVDIGGGVGHQCAQMKDRFPHTPGRVILQDLPHSIEKALDTPGVEKMAYNFFEPQPVKGLWLSMPAISTIEG